MAAESSKESECTKNLIQAIVSLTELANGISDLGVSITRISGDQMASREEWIQKHCSRIKTAAIHLHTLAAAMEVPDKGSIHLAVVIERSSLNLSESFSLFSKETSILNSNPEAALRFVSDWDSLHNCVAMFVHALRLSNGSWWSVLRQQHELYRLALLDSLGMN